MVILSFCVQLDINQIIKMKSREIPQKGLFLCGELFLPVAATCTCIIFFEAAVLFNFLTMKMVPFPAHITKHPINFGVGVLKGYAKAIG